MRKESLPKLSDCYLQAISSPADLARRLSTGTDIFSVAELRSLAKDEGNFHHFEIRKEAKSSRPIQEPTRRLQQIHKRIHKLLARVEVPAYLHSAVRGKSYISNAAAHDATQPTIKIDIQKFYPSVPRASIYTFFFVAMKCRRDVAGLLADLLTCKAHLPTGSSASSIMSFYAFKPMFDEIERFAQSKNLTMTCYVDDIALTGFHATKNNLYEIKKIVAQYGLKSHKCRVFRPAQPKIITGICKTVAGSRVPNKLHLDIKRTFNTLSFMDSQKSKQKLLSILLGRLDAAGQIEPLFKARAKNLRSHAKALFQASIT
jgi:hypothetical protein